MPTLSIITKSSTRKEQPGNCANINSSKQLQLSTRVGIHMSSSVDCESVKETPFNPASLPHYGTVINLSSIKKNNNSALADQVCLKYFIDVNFSILSHFICVLILMIAI